MIGNVCICAQTLKLIHRANLVIYALAAHEQSYFVTTDRHSDSFQSRQKVSTRTWKGYCEEEAWTGTNGGASTPVNVFTRLIPQQNPHLVKMTGRSALQTTTSRHGIPAKGEKVTYTSAVRGAMEKWPVNARRRPRAAPENSAGICIVKGLRGARWGTDRLFVSRGITY